jgi:cytoskeletal protein CcmA (bactofilin family)
MSALPRTSSDDEVSEETVVGPAIAIRGRIEGEEDLVVEGRIEGAITLAGHLTVAENGIIEANLDVDSVEVRGEVIGDISAARSITIQQGARVRGNVRAPRVIINDGARFRGSVEMKVDLPDDLAKVLSRS